MELGLIGLGRMGASMARRLARGGHRVVGVDRAAEIASALAGEEPNVEAAASLDEMIAMLSPPRIVWIMLPAGDATEQAIGALQATLSPGDTIVDGGNSCYKDTARRAAEAAARGLHFVDVGTSGGVWGLSAGYSLTVGGEEAAVARLRPLFEALAPAPDRGWGRVGPSGSGHFVKMVHNGIEYGLMEAYAEGFALLRAKETFSLDLHQVAQIWRRGSVVRSWLLDLIADALADDPELSGLAGWVDDSGEGRWAVCESIALDVPAPVIALALQMRFVSRQGDSYAARVLAALRHRFGGHTPRAADDG